MLMRLMVMLDLCKLYKLHRLAFLAVCQARFVLESPFNVNQKAINFILLDISMIQKLQLD